MLDDTLREYAQNLHHQADSEDLVNGPQIVNGSREEILCQVFSRHPLDVTATSTLR